MKTLHSHAVVYGATMTALIFTLSCVGQTNVLFYGTNASSIGVSFVDTNLSASAKAPIVADLQVCLGEWGKLSELDLGNYEPGVVGYLYNFKHNPHYPEEIEFPRKLITNSVSGIALQVPKALSDAYTNAFAFAAANSNIVAAAYEFVTFVSSSNFVSLSSNALPNYVIEKNTPSNEIVAGAQATLSELQNQTYYPPSVLGFQYSDTGPSATNLWMLVPCSSPSGSGWMEWSPFPAVWHDGKWKFCFWQD